MDTVSAARRRAVKILTDNAACKCASDSSSNSPDDVWHDSEESLPASVTVSEDEECSRQQPEPALRKYYICDSQLHERILENLSAEDLLSCRLVCQNWYNIIGGSALLWKRCCMTFTRYRLKGIEAAYSKLDLIKKFHCPNFTFNCMDLRDEIFRNLFVIYGLQLKYLKIINCFFSKSTFDLILLQCPNLEYFHVNCMPLSVSLCDSIFPPELHFSVKFPKLRTLILERLNSKPDISAKDKDQSWKEENLNGENLSGHFLQQLIESCKALRRIRLSGWQGATMYNLLNCINCRSQLSTLKSIEFENVSGQLDESHLFAFCSSNVDFKLEMLSISFKNELSPSKKGENFDTVLEVALEGHRDTLRVLSLENVPITEKAFRNVFPQLRTMRLSSTWIKNVEEIFHLFPRLEVIDYTEYSSHCGKAGRVGSGRDGRKLRDGTEKVTLLDQFFQCTIYDRICLASFASVVTSMVMIALVFQFDTYGQWFIFIGFLLLVAICIADYYQNSNEMLSDDN